MYIDDLLDRYRNEMACAAALQSAALGWMRAIDIIDEPLEYDAARRLLERARAEHVGLAFEYVGANEQARGR